MEEISRTQESETCAGSETVNHNFLSVLQKSAILLSIAPNTGIEGAEHIIVLFWRGKDALSDQWVPLI